MKQILALVLFCFAFAQSSTGQNINWPTYSNQSPHSIYLNFGYDFGLTAQIGYAHRLNTQRPIALSIDFSVPMGDQLFDDHKVRFGGQMEVVSLGDFSATARAYGTFRRYQNELVRMAGFGADLSAVAGIYRPNWHLAGEFGFDKSITTHLKHTPQMRDDFPRIQDGWYIPSGGHFYYGLQTGVQIGDALNLSLRAGLTNAEGADEDALLPYYAQLGLMHQF